MAAKATIIGRLTRDPETTDVVSNGEPIQKTTFSVAVDDSYGKDSTTSFFDCVAWNGLGTNLAKFQHKGDQVAVFGRLKQSRWEKDGAKRQKVELIAEQIEFIGSKRERDDIPAAVQNETAPSSTPAAPAAEVETTPTPVVESPAETLEIPF